LTLQQISIKNIQITNQNFQIRHRMCGIAGIINYKNYDLKKIENSLIHRGPDVQSIFCEDNVALIHTRLSIVDIQFGNQPIHIAGCTIIYNGEVYNHNNLRYMLKNFNFSTKSDTETLLALYLNRGEKMLDLIDGMFAFAILDRKKNCIFLARDRAGKKPLYYAITNNSFIFASELNAIKTAASVETDEEAIAAYIRCGFFPSPTTPYKNIYELQPGHFMHVNIASLNIVKKKYFFIDKIYSEQMRAKDIPFYKAVERVNYLLDMSIKDRLISTDLEAGVFLSGGIDSSLITAKASKYIPDIKTFTISFDGAYDESHLASLTAKKYKTDHKRIKISINLKKDIEKILAYHGKPFMDSSAIPSYYISKAAKKYLTVVLNGDGADEMFAGYRRHVIFMGNILKKFKKLIFFKKILPNPHQKKSYYNYLYRLIDAADKTKGLDLYLSLTIDGFEGFENQIRKSALLPALDDKIKSIFSSRLSPLSQILQLDFEILLPSDLLQKMDIASMANSLEARSPFLSKYLIEFAPKLPDEFKINKFTTKHILREVAKKYLPKKLIKQPKRGFEVPLKKWVENDIKEIIIDMLAPGCYSENFVEKKFLRDLIQKKITVSDEKRAKMLWILFCLETWKNNL